MSSNNSMNDCLFSLQDVNFSINGKKILQNITVDLEPNGITGIIGPSGAGKSTFLLLLNKLLSPTNGEIFFQGKNLLEFPSRDLRKLVGMVQQHPFLFPGTVRDNLEFGPKIWRIDYSEEELIELLAKVALSSDFLDREIDGLSGGEQQRVNFARSLANKPCVLLLDEPSSALDIISEEIIEKTIIQLAKEGVKIIIVTHSLQQTQKLTQQLLFLKEGQLIEKTSTEDFFKKYDEEEIRTFFKKGKEEK